MGSCCGSDAPEPPNPYVTAGAQTSSNIGTAIASQQLNQTNQITPDGSLTHDITGYYSYTDPVNMATYQIPRTTMTQTLSPQQQAIKTQQDAAKLNLSSMANNQSQRISGLLSSEMDYGSVHGGGQLDWMNNPAYYAQTGFDSGGPIQYEFGDAGELTRDYGPADNFSADRKRVEDSLFARMDPQLKRDDERLRAQLADQGIRYGSAAYNAAYADQIQRTTDARLGVTAAGGAEQQRMNQMAAQRAAFQNTAQQQAYEQAKGRAGFWNEAQARQFGQNQSLASFGNTARAQNLGLRQSLFNAAQARRASDLNEMYARRNQPINEISALMNGSQVSNPNFVNAPTTQIASTDVAGIINKGYDQQANAYAQSQSTMNAILGGLMGAAGNIYRSDKRTKKNIEKIGTVFSTNADAKPRPGSVIGERKELPIYEYAYKDDPSGARHVGPMAQDVEKIDRRAVLHDDEGTKYIDKRRMIGGILRAA